jgi:hypothetical protein
MFYYQMGICGNLELLISLTAYQSTLNEVCMAVGSSARFLNKGSMLPMNLSARARLSIIPTGRELKPSYIFQALPLV